MASNLIEKYVTEGSVRPCEVSYLGGIKLLQMIMLGADGPTVGLSTVCPRCLFIALAAPLSPM